MNMSAHSRTARQAGLSLVELMIALAIGTVLVFGLLQVFSASRAAYQTSEGLARVQENARFAMEFLQRDIRMAGHYGCVNDQAHKIDGYGQPVMQGLGAAAALDFSVSIEGHEAPDTAPGNSLTLGASWSAPTGSGLPTLSPVPVGGSDILVLRYLAPLGVEVTGIGGSNGEVLSFDSADAANLSTEGVTPTLFGVADCRHVNVFAGSASGGTVTGTGITSPLSVTYGTEPSGTMLHRAESLVYYVGNNPGGEPALYRARANNSGSYTSEELVEGIESLQLLYGQDAQTVLSSTTRPMGNITVHGTAAQVRSAGSGDLHNAWLRVGLVRVGLLARSPERAAAAGSVQPIEVLGTAFTPAASGDGRYRASYESTIALRNRLFGN